MGNFQECKKFYFLIQFFLCLSLLFSSSCQQGKKEDGQSQSYNEVLVKCDSLEEDLAKEKVILKDKPLLPSEMKDLDFSLRLTAEENKVQLLLEQYVITSQKLLDAGDTKVVLFPEKNRIQQSLNNATTLLGYLYAKIDENGITHAIQEKNLDYSEFSYRFARYNYYLRYLKDLRIPSDDIKAASEEMKNLTDEQLSQIVAMGSTITIDLPRVRVLSERNKNWTLGVGITSTTNEDAILSQTELYWKYTESAKVTLKTREKKTEKFENSKKNEQLAL